MRILGIDPGYGITGFGIIEAQRGACRLLRCGAITTPPNTDFNWRLGEIYNNMTELMQLAQADAVAIEELFFGNNVTTGIKVAQARGVILLAVQQAEVPVYEYTKRILNLPAVPKPDDAADAVAIALCHARSSTSLLAMAQK